jgi:eukaryotic-like serine/threonine-protein kinase
VAITPRSVDAGVGIGEIFVEKYRVDAILGHGGMGVVAACTHLALNERVAIKMLRKDVLDDADAVERFMREAQAAVKLKSEYVARVTDVGRSTSNVPYMVMEYLEGHDLGELLDERGRLGMPWAIELTLQACEALAEAHSLGIVHRDVKPTNLFVTWRPDGSALVKVLDFGISKALTSTAMQLTQTQSLLGTPAYMSPEQMRSARMVDARTDIWSLGTVLYEMIEGRRPFEAESFSEMCVKVAVDPPASMTTAPPELQQVVLRCLEKAPEQRYASMADLARDLVPFSTDRHQALVLVERMTRTLRRSSLMSAEWSASSSGSGSVRQLWSGERAAEVGSIENAVTPPARLARSSASSPAAQPEPSAPSTGVPSDAAPIDSSGPMPALPRRITGSSPALSETLSVSRPRRRHGLAIATAVIAAAALGVVVSLLRTPTPASEPPAPAAAPTHAIPPQPSVAEPPAANGTATPGASARSSADSAARSGATVPPVVVPPPPIADAVIAPAAGPSTPTPSTHDGKPKPRAGHANRVNKPDAERTNKAPAADGKSPATPGPDECAWDAAHALDASGRDRCAKGSGAPPQH